MQSKLVGLLAFTVMLLTSTVTLADGNPPPPPPTGDHGKCTSGCMNTLPPPPNWK